MDGKDLGDLAAFKMSSEFLSTTLVAPSREHVSRKH